MFQLVMLLQLPGPHVAASTIDAHKWQLPGVIAYFVRFHVRLTAEYLHAEVVRQLLHARVYHQKIKKGKRHE